MLFHFSWTLTWRESCLNKRDIAPKGDRWHLFRVGLCRTLYSLELPCIAELLCSVKSAHIVPADEWQMFYSWRKDSVHSLKHIPGFMKRVKDGGRRFERNEDWLNPPFQPFLPSDEEGILTLFMFEPPIYVNLSPTNYLLICVKKYKSHSTPFTYWYNY